MEKKTTQVITEDIVVRHGKTVTIQCVKDDRDEDCVHIVVVTEQSSAPWSYNCINESGEKNKADTERLRQPAALALSCLIAITSGALCAFIVSLLARIIL